MRDTWDEYRTFDTELREMPVYVNYEVKDWGSFEVITKDGDNVLELDHNEYKQIEQEITDHKIQSEDYLNYEQWLEE